MRGWIVLCLVLAYLVALTAGYRHHRPHRPHRPTHYHGPKGDMPLKIYPQGPHPPPCFHRGAVAGANRLFAVDLYKKAKGVSGSGNIILSPFSISTALAMTYAGARGTTESQMKNVLRFNSFPFYCSVNQGFKDLLLALSATNHNHTLKVANRVFIESTLSVLSSYKQVTKNYYGAEAVVVPFSSMASLCRQLINNWVGTQTDGKIDNLLPAGSVDPQTVMVLVNAITFKGFWKHEFSARMTKYEAFHQSSTRHVYMMHMGCGPKNFRYAYVSSIKSAVVELPFYNSKIAMYVVLPRKNLRLSYVEKKFSWNPNTLGLKPRLMSISLPKFKVKKDTAMTALLKALGMKDLFNEAKADLTRIAGSSSKLWVDEVYHQAYINVEETGTDASAATAVVVCKAPRIRRRSPELVVNRPFLFFIWDKETDSLLFNGRFMG